MAKQTAHSLPRAVRALPYILIIGGIIGLLCAFIIMTDKISLLTNPHFRPNCDLNPVISCGSVMASKQGSAFGFPNPIIGLVAFPVLMSVGVSILAGATFKQWFWRWFNIGLLLAVIFIHWLFFQSVYRIQALCPYCMVVWVVTITTLWYVTLYNLQQGNITVPRWLRRGVAFSSRYHVEILITWLLIIAALILQHFWYYYGRYI